MTSRQHKRGRRDARKTLVLLRMKQMDWSVPGALYSAEMKNGVLEVTYNHQGTVATIGIPTSVLDRNVTPEMVIMSTRYHAAKMFGLEEQLETALHARLAELQKQRNTHPTGDTHAFRLIE